MAQHEDIHIDQGASFKGKIVIHNADDGTPFDTTGYSAAGSLKKTIGGPVVASFTCILSNNEVVIQLEPEQTDILTNEQYLYDILMVSGDKTYRPIRGIAYVTRKIT